IQHACGLFGGPQNGLPQIAPTTPPITAPGGPATTSPVPAPNAAPTASACEAVGAANKRKTGAAAKKILRMVASEECRSSRPGETPGGRVNSLTFGSSET